MSARHDDLDRTPSPARWRETQRVLRGLPVIADEPGSVQAILDATVELASSTGNPSALPNVLPNGDHETIREHAGARQFRTVAAAAAAIAIVAFGAWFWNDSATDAELSESELARLDAEVELALVHLGRVLHGSDRLDIINIMDAFGANSATPTIGPTIVD